MKSFSRREFGATRLATSDSAHFFAVISYALIFEKHLWLTWATSWKDPFVKTVQWGKSNVQHYQNIFLGIFCSFSIAFKPGRPISHSTRHITTSAKSMTARITPFFGDVWMTMLLIVWSVLLVNTQQRMNASESNACWKTFC